MVAPTRPSAVNTTDASYSAVPNPQVGSPELNDPYANLSGANLPQDSYLSPEGVNTPILGQDSMHMPAPSMKSRTSTNESLLGGTPNLNSDRSSWASNAALAPGGADVSHPPDHRIASCTDIRLADLGRPVDNPICNTRQWGGTTLPTIDSPSPTRTTESVMSRPLAVSGPARVPPRAAWARSHPGPTTGSTRRRRSRGRLGGSPAELAFSWSSAWRSVLALGKHRLPPSDMSYRTHATV
jgi:hypothetical protein